MQRQDSGISGRTKQSTCAVLLRLSLYPLQRRIHACLCVAVRRACRIKHVTQVVGRALEAIVAAALEPSSSAPVAPTFDLASRVLARLARDGPVFGRDPLAINLVNTLNAMLRGAIAHPGHSGKVVEATDSVYAALSQGLVAGQRLTVAADAAMCSAPASGPAVRVQVAFPQCGFGLGLARDEPHHLLRARHTTPLGMALAVGPVPDAALRAALVAGAAAYGQYADLHMTAWQLHDALAPANFSFGPPTDAITQSVSFHAVEGRRSGAALPVRGLSNVSRVTLQFPSLAPPGVPLIPYPEALCSYWDPATAFWRTDGVETALDAAVTVCSTAHLTPFALALPMQPEPSPSPDPGDDSALAVIIVLSIVVALMLAAVLIGVGMLYYTRYQERQQQVWCGGGGIRSARGQGCIRTADNRRRRGGVTPPWTQISSWETMKSTKGNIDLGHFWYINFWVL